jgi:hypothetical protein
MDFILSWITSWKGQFDTTNLFQPTILRHQYPDHFIPIYYPIHRNTGVRIHDVYINRSNELLLRELMNTTLPSDLKQTLFFKHYQEPPSAVGIRYRHQR